MSTTLAHHFDDAEQQYLASNLGMWVFLVTEIMFFGGLFTGYTMYRYDYPHAFAEGSRHLDLLLGAVNTGVLLTSSLAMALAVHAAQTEKRKATVGWLLVTILLGAVFLAIKFYEYWHKYETHLLPGTGFRLEDLSNRALDPGMVELFFSFYFAMTGVHALHMLIGISVLTVITVMAWKGRFSADYNTPVEMTGLYWHFVDIIWVFLFPLLYLI